MGFLAQCEICPQKAILTEQLDGWVCPRCADAGIGGGFGDVDISAADPLLDMAQADARVSAALAAAPPVTQQVPDQPTGITLALDDPLAAAIQQETARNPERPLITAIVAGRTFTIRGWTLRRNSGLTVDWVDHEEHLKSITRMISPPELMHPDVRLDDSDEPDYGHIRG